MYQICVAFYLYTKCKILSIHNCSYDNVVQFWNGTFKEQAVSCCFLKACALFFIDFTSLEIRIDQRVKWFDLVDRPKFHQAIFVINIDSIIRTGLYIWNEYSFRKGPTNVMIQCHH